MKCFWKPNAQGHPDAFFICSQAANVLFSVCAKSIYCPVLLTFSAVETLPKIHVPLISQTPPGLHQQGLASYWNDTSYYDCALKLSPQNKTSPLFTETETSTESIIVVSLQEASEVRIP